MKTQWILPIIISLVLAVVAAKFADNWITNRLTTAAESDESNLLPVVAAATPIPAGTTVEPVHIKVVRLPEEAKPPGSYADPNELIGQVAKQSVYTGEIIVNERFANSPGASALAAIIPEGKRAITVAVNDVVGVAGFILPGSRVDIIASEGGQLKTILQNIKVLAIGQSINQEKNDAVRVSVVTLEVDPVQAEIVAKAQGLRLTLRNPVDSILVAEKQENKPALAEKTNPQPAPAPVQRDALYAVDVVRGTAVTTTTMDY